jgi:hypothetical protein
MIVCDVDANRADGFLHIISSSSSSGGGGGEEGLRKRLDFLKGKPYFAGLKNRGNYSTRAVWQVELIARASVSLGQYSRA